MGSANCGFEHPENECEKQKHSNSALIGLLEAETLAKRFHDTYERLAPQYGYLTRKLSRVDWEDVSTKNKKLMIATCQELLNEGI